MFNNLKSRITTSIAELAISMNPLKNGAHDRRMYRERDKQRVLDIHKKPAYVPHFARVGLVANVPSARSQRTVAEVTELKRLAQLKRDRKNAKRLGDSLACELFNPCKINRGI